LSNFKLQETRVLVATDIAARGIDIDELSHVINYELPNIPETYVHRIGRTGRAGASGISISFCDAEERAYLKDIQKLIGKSVPVAQDNPYPLSQSAMNSPVVAPKPQQQQRRQGFKRPANAGSYKSSNSNKSTSAHKSGNSHKSNNSKPASSSSAPARRSSRDWRSMSQESNY
jgi:ATP-dependent RNA helicase RhlE